ncbi:unnamed protein product [Polarella glacialis]|uniref:Uncharacterized protein n=1 Tax=Polarella glacialis TaxID=89957 RepID=A0A813K0M0_POLGL|nr:unnamed protein product [Polarella glacialis]
MPVRTGIRRGIQNSTTSDKILKIAAYRHEEFSLGDILEALTRIIQLGDYPLEDPVLIDMLIRPLPDKVRSGKFVSNPTVLASVIHKLAKLKLRRSFLQQVMMELCTMTVQYGETLSPRSISNVLWAMATMKVELPEVFHALC